MSPLVNIAIPAVLLFLCCTVLAVSAQENRDEIKVLPGFAMNPEQKMYSGYIQVDPIHNRQLFYWFVESSSSTRGTDPLVLWTNGGPGCSSVSGGLFSEFGPFFPKSDGSLGLTPNPWTWTSGANVIFIEQPAGVGFSFSDDTADYTTGDKQSADDIYMFLQSFLQKYPQFLTRDFYLTGESYGGHYVPKFAQKIIEMNRRVRDNTTANAHINLKGFAIGNAWTVAEIENTGAVDFWYQRTMIDATIRDGIFKTCNMSDVGPLVAKTFQSVEADWEIHFQGVPMGSKKAVRPLGFTPLYDELLSQKHQFQAKVHAGLDCDAWQAKAFDKIGGIDIYDMYVWLNCGRRHTTLFLIEIGKIIDDIDGTR